MLPAPPRSRCGAPRDARLLLAAAILTLLAFATDAVAFAVLHAGGGSLAAGALGAAAASALGLAAIRLCSQVARPGRGVPGDMIGYGRSQQVGSAIAVHLAVLLAAEPVLYAAGRALGFGGTTGIALTHRSAGFVLLATWSAVVIAPWLEEVSMRGFLLSGLTPRLGFWPAALVSSFTWAAIHGVSGVLLPFTGLGIALCWIRRRTGSIRMGIALHAAVNTWVTLATSATPLVAVAAAGTALSLVATQAGSTSRPSSLARQLIRSVQRTAETVAAGLAPRRGPGTWAWLAAGAGIATVPAADLLLPAGAAGTDLRRAAGSLSLGLLVWLLLDAHRNRRTPATTTLAGAAGGISFVVAVAISGNLAIALIGAGYALLAFGLLGLSLGSLPDGARNAAVLAGSLLAAELAPLPYLVSTREQLRTQTRLSLFMAGMAIVTLGAAIRAARPDTAAAGLPPPPADG